MEILHLTSSNEKFNSFSTSSAFFNQELQNADLLKCGSCSSEFLLSDIVIFIQHKTKSCKIEACDNKENNLSCCTCSESFENAYSLLEHAQFIHKLEIFKENSIKSKHQEKHKRTSFSYNNGSSNGGSMSQGVLESRANSNKSQPTKNEIFIDVIPSDSNMNFADINQSYNIKVSSTSSGGTSSYLSSQNLKQFDSSVNAKQKEVFSDNSSKKSFAKDSMDNNDNDNSSCSNDSSNKYDDQPSGSNGVMVGNQENANAELNYDDSNSKGPMGDEKQRKKSKQTASFLCDVCKAAFNQKIHLTKHSAKHTGIKPFKCTECNYSTVERSHLKVHVRVHTGEKPFKCTICEYATAQSSTLKIHKKRHHDNNKSSEQAAKFKTEENKPKDESANQNHIENQSFSNNSRNPSTSSIDSKMPSASQNEAQLVNHATELSSTTSDSQPASSSMNQTNNLAVSNGDSNNTNEKRNYEFDSIYKNKKNLPLVKRFKNYLQEESMLNNNTNHLATDEKNQESVEPKTEPLNNSLNITKDLERFRMNDSSDSASLKVTPEKTSAPVKSAPTTNENKLLGLANIALERETN